MGCFVSCCMPCFCIDPDEWDLRNVQYKDCVPFVPPIRMGKVVKVYDGDTFTVASKIKMTHYSKGKTKRQRAEDVVYTGKDSYTMFRFSVRLRGIDCPELTSSDPTEKRKAEEARNFLSNMILNKCVYLDNVGTEKYGRLLADVYIKKTNIAKKMLDMKLGIPYSGGKKETK